MARKLLRPDNEFFVVILFFRDRSCLNIEESCNARGASLTIYREMRAFETRTCVTLRAAPVKYTALSTAELLRICVAASDAEPWEELIRRFHSLIAGAVGRCARRWSEPSPAIHEELVQEAWFKLFRERHSILERLAALPEEAIPGFLKVFIVNLVHDHFRAVRASKRAPPDRLLDLHEEREMHGSLTTTTRMEREILLSEVNEILESRTTGASAERDRQIFWLYHRHGMTAHEIASISYLGLSDKGVESVLFRMTALVKQGLARERKVCS
jgi:RNA polymerase sigma-70 factor, ECF subfamily